MRILEECVRCFISSLFMGIFLAKAHCRYIPLIQRFKIIVFSLRQYRTEKQTQYCSI